MTTIPNLNVVVQQGSSARDAQNVRQSQDAAQVVTANQPEKETEQRTTVQSSNESDALKANKEKSSKEKEEKKKKKKAKEDDEVTEAKHDPDAPGQLLDVQA